MFIAFLPGIIFSLLCGYFGVTALRAVALLTLTVGFQGFATAGYFVNHLDIAPQYSGVLMGISSTIGNTPGFIATLVTKALTPEVRISSSLRLSL